MPVKVNKQQIDAAKIKLQNYIKQVNAAKAKADTLKKQYDAFKNPKSPVNVTPINKPANVTKKTVQTPKAQIKKTVPTKPPVEVILPPEKKEPVRDTYKAFGREWNKTTVNVLGGFTLLGLGALTIKALSR